jgi:hypothetical protein
MQKEYSIAHLSPVKAIHKTASMHAIIGMNENPNARRPG